jgi:hypothetical protein
VANLSPRKSTRASRQANVVKKGGAYEALAALNQHFEQVLQDLDRLRELGLVDTRFHRESLQACQAMIEETRAWLNFGVVEVLRDREEGDRAHFGRIRYQWEKKFEDPQDLLIRAKGLKRQAPARKPGKR